MAAASTKSNQANSAPASTPAKSTREITDEIIKRIDVVAAYKEAGLLFTDDKPRASGFIECYAFAREDSRPSGYVNALTGMYGDSATGEKITFWDFMRAHHPSVPPPGDFFSVLKHFAGRAGIEIDTKDSHKKKNSYDNPAEVFEWLPDSQSHSFLWTFAYRRSSSVEALRFSGCQIARWRCFNKKTKGSDQIERIIGRELVCTVPFFKPESISTGDVTPAAYQCWNVTGQPLPLYAGKDKPPELLKIVSAGPIRGTLANSAAIKWLHDAQAIATSTNSNPPVAARVWKTCGPSDMLALLSIIPAELLNHPQHPHLVTTNGNGESGDCTLEQAKLFTAQNTFIPADADPSGAGINGARKWGNALAAYTPTIRIFQLFEPTAENKEAGRNDLRDWIRERKENPLLTADEIYAELCELADKAGVYEPEKSHASEAVLASGAGSAGSGDQSSTTTPAPTPATGPKKITNQEEYYLGGKQYKRPLKPQQIVADILAQTNNWPRRIGEQLFHYSEKTNKLTFLDSTSSLFGWLHSNCEGVDWQRGCELITQDQFFQEMPSLVTEYAGVEFIPQWPQVDGIFYACKYPEEPEEKHIGDAIAGLVDMFSFETPTDYAMATAFVLTMYWGHNGTKPAFMITARAGRGAGKTTFVDELAGLAGGFIDFSGQVSSEVVLQKLLSDAGMRKRICRIDNVKANRFSWDTLESLITADVITGKKMYVGEASRPNNLIWCMTMNGPSLSTDMAQRSIEIQLKKPENRKPGWLAKLKRYIAVNREKIAGDAIAMLKQSKCEIPEDQANDSRWGFWFAEIIGRLCRDEAQARAIYSNVMHVTKTRERNNDDEADDFNEFSGYISNEIEKFGYRPNAAVHIPAGVLADWYREHSGTRGENRSIIKMIRRAIDQGQITVLYENSSHKKQRGFVYRDSPGNDAITEYTLEALWFEFRRTRQYPKVF